MEIKNSEIVVIGAGKLAFSLVYHLKTNNFKVAAILSRDKKSAKKLAEKFKISKYNEFDGTLPEKGGVFFLTLPDDCLEVSARKIAAAKQVISGKMFIHFSGTQSSSVLRSLKRKNGLIASFHIMQTFPSRKPVKIRNCFAAIETADESLRYSLFNFASQLELKPFRISPESKILYHMAGVFTSNFLISHFSNSETVYKSTGIESAPYNIIFNNIINETIRNIKIKGALNSISGPAARGDISTIKDHIDLLKKKKNLLLLINYITESLTLSEILMQKDVNRKQNLVLRNYLKKELKAVVKLLSFDD